jgi:hypothetical protein
VRQLERALDAREGIAPSPHAPRQEQPA